MAENFQHPMGVSSEVPTESAGQGNTRHAPEDLASLDTCHTCNAILSAFASSTDKLYSANLGTLREVRSSACDNHQSLFLWFCGEVDEDTDGDAELSIFRHRKDPYAELLCGRSLLPAFELINRQDKTATLPAQIHGRGCLLDEEWIDLTTVKRWYNKCREHHGDDCQSPPFHLHLDARPRLLIDTQQGCLVSAKEDYNYAALSYVWGEVDCLTLTTENFATLVSSGGLHQKDILERIPTTVVHAMDLSRLLGHRYLWVDSLCIQQDGDYELIQAQLNSMTAIFANASLTIVAAEGTNAASGLNGVQHLRWPQERESPQELIPFGPYHSVVARIFPPKNQRSDSDIDKVTNYYRRAWTFQEYLFSKRRLIFERDSVLWDCQSDCWFEDVVASSRDEPMKRYEVSPIEAVLNSAAPDLYHLVKIIDEFNQKELTYDEDCLAAFAGISTVLTRRFVGGFLCGLPEMFFDVAMLWQPNGEMRRRKGQTGGADGRATSLPSWSWAGWHGSLDPWSWQSGTDFIKQGGTLLISGTTRQTIPITDWYVGASADAIDRRPIIQTWHIFKMRYRDSRCPVPVGWTRHASLSNSQGNVGMVPDQAPPDGFGEFFYTHESHGRRSYWYPFPTAEASETPITREVVRYLFATVQSSTFYADGQTMPSYVICISLWNRQGDWAGIMRPHTKCTIIGTPQRQYPMDLVAISRGKVKNVGSTESHLEEWPLEERNKQGEWYEFYNVLWVSWKHGVAQRRGLGRIERSMWERSDPKQVQLILE